MANVDSPFGLKPVKHLSGASWNGQTMRCFLNTSESNAMFIGDAVDLGGTADAKGVAPTVVKATVALTNPIFGVITAFEYDPTNLSLNYRTAGTARYCYVCCDPDVIFEIQGDSVAVIAITAVGSNADLIYTHSGSTATGISGMELNSSTLATTSSCQLKILGLVDREDNDISSVNAKWLVMINSHRLRAAGVNTVGTAVAGAVGV